jgi:hypothetical protein
VDQSFTAEERRLIELWERHLHCEFAGRDAAATVATMSDENYVNHVPVLTGGRGRSEMLEFYGRHFIPQIPADTTITPVCRTVGQGRVVDEMIFAFTHDIEMDWTRMYSIVRKGASPDTRSTRRDSNADPARHRIQLRPLFQFGPGRR